MTVLVFLLMMTMANLMSMIVRFVLVIVTVFVIMFAFVCHFSHPPYFSYPFLPNIGDSRLEPNYPIRPFPFKVQQNRNVRRPMLRHFQDFRRDL